MNAKSMQPPELKGTSEGITGWTEFEFWATRNISIWKTARTYCTTVGMNPNEYVKLVAYYLSLENREMKDALVKHAEENGKPLYVGAHYP